MRSKLIAIALLIAFLPGCFAIGLGAIGSSTDNDGPRAAPGQPTSYPAGGQGGATPGRAAAKKQADDEGMSGGTTGFLVGAIIDVALIALTIHAVGSLDWGDCGLYGCGDNY